MTLKLRRDAPGYYTWKNGITVIHEGKNWNVYWCCGDLAYSGDTLAECKTFLYHKYPDSFRF